MLVGEELTFSNMSTTTDTMCASIVITPDEILENDEIFTLTLSFITDPAPSDITINPASAQVTITDNNSK